MLAQFRDDIRYPSFYLDFDLEGKIPDKGRGCVSCHVSATCLVRIAIIRDNFGTRADASSGRYTVHHFFTLNLTLNVKRLVKVHGRVGCPGRLYVV